ncbi:MAG: legionaminic acid biosynthesis protein PtmG, partial [Anaerocolumna sp.]|nr:legionaminic acid biosynthesis protein PtmG [Anaerocolumna sp.]
LLAWIMSVQTVIFKIATMFNIPLVMFGEEGEVEYGGTNALKNRAFYDVEDSIKLYLSGNDPSEYLKHFSEKELYWWLYPSPEEMRSAGLEIAKWSYFENWDPYEHYLFSKEKCGLKEKEDRCTSTYNNFGQTDTILYDLHVYLMYLKFGFGRCSQDVGIDIRRGAMNRSQGLALVKLYDGEYPAPYIDGYLKYFEMTQEEFDSVLDRHANKALFRKKDGRWISIFTPE